MRARRSVKKDPLETAVFFIDRSVGKKTVARPLRDAGLKVELHDDHFPQDAPDEEWLTEIGRRRWCVITRDDRIRYRHLEAQAVRSAKVAMFVIVSKNLTGPKPPRSSSKPSVASDASSPLTADPSSPKFTAMDMSRKSTSLRDQTPDAARIARTVGAGTHRGCVVRL